MSEELTRHKEALKVAIGALRELGLDYAHFTNTVESRVAAILDPPQEFEDMPLERWAVVAPSGFVEMTVSSEGAAEREVEEEGGRYHGYQVAKLTGTIKRPVKKPVVREVEVEGVSLGGSGGICHWPGMAYGGNIFRDTDAAGKTVTLIARWTE